LVDCVRAVDRARCTERAERSSYEQVYLDDRLRVAAARINPSLGSSVIDEAVKRLERAKRRVRSLRTFACTPC